MCYIKPHTSLEIASYGNKVTADDAQSKIRIAAVVVGILPQGVPKSPTSVNVKLPWDLCTYVAIKIPQKGATCVVITAK